jgi:arylsulfatase/arylsulfatase A
LLALAACSAPPRVPPEPQPRGPNVIVIVTDDQGYGDFGFQGNPVLRTPHLDALAAASAQATTFYVNPVCAPTRAALLTGRHCQRTRAIDTYRGRAMLEPAEVTLAEALRDAGFATGIFGKWHLGDCYPMRPIDQGFEESLVHRGGGIGQPSDFEGGERRYTDPWLLHDDRLQRAQGWCTDVYFDAAIAWLRAQHSQRKPFFALITPNAPHGPFGDVPQELYEHYRALDLAPAAGSDDDRDRLARIFAMIDNIDANIGKLSAALDEIGAARDTLVVFLTDNGPETLRWNAGLRGRKSEVFDGGIRTPLLLRWPARLEAGARIDRIAAHIDVMPTILEACGVPAPRGAPLDGRSLLPLFEGRAEDWPDRALVIQTHRGDRTVRYHNAMVRTQRWKLVNDSGFGREVDSVEPAFALYDMEADPAERDDVAAAHPEVVARLRAAYEQWYEDVAATRPDNWAPPRIVLGAPQSPNVTLTPQDRRVDGAFEVLVADAGPYRVRVRFSPGAQHVRFQLGATVLEADVAPDERGHSFTGVALPPGAGRLRADVRTERGVASAHHIHIERAGRSR